MWQEVDTSEATSSGGPYPEIDHSEFSYEIFVYEGLNVDNALCVMQHRVENTESTNPMLHAIDGSATTSSAATETNRFTVTRLKPATDYLVNIRATILKNQNAKEICVNMSPETHFRTMPSRPNAPLMPRLVRRYPNSIALTWRPSVDNGAAILGYMLQIAKVKLKFYML